MFPHPFGGSVAPPAFDHAALSSMPASEGSSGEIQVIEVYPRKREVFTFREHGAVTQWRGPRKDQEYLIGAVAGVTAVFDVRTGEQMAMLKGELTLDQFVDQLALLATFYNFARVIPAADESFVWKLVGAYEPLRIFRGDMPGVIGFEMIPSGLPRLVNALASGIHTGRIQLRSQELIQECVEFQRAPDGSCNPRSSPCVWAAALAAYGIEIAPKPASPMRQVKGLEPPDWGRPKRRRGF